MTFRNEEKTSAQGQTAIYSLSSITVPLGGWKIHTIAIYTLPRKPEGWLQVNRARLNIFPRKGDLPDAQDDPQRGKEVSVTIRKVQNSVYEVRSSELDLVLRPGEYWIGLTPICRSENHGQAGHVVVSDVHDARFDDAVRSPDGDRGAQPYLREWKLIGPGLYQALGEHLSIKVQGWRLPRGRFVDWPVEEARADKKQLHLRFATFEPLTEAPKIPEGYGATADGRLWIVQCHATADQEARDQLTRSGAQLLRYLPDDAYLVALAPEAANQIRRLPRVRWVGPYQPAYRIDPNVFPEPSKRASFGDELPRDEPKGMRKVLVNLFHREAEEKEALAKVIREAGGKIVFQSSQGFYLAADVPLDQLPTVAGHNAVCGIERRYEVFDLLQDPAKYDAKRRITLAQIRALCGADAVKNAGGYEGLGVRVGLWDDGIRENHVDLLGRPLTFLGPRVRAIGNHGTPIASILCGEGRGDPNARGLLPLGGLIFASCLSADLSARRADLQYPFDTYGLVDRLVKDYHVLLLSNSTGGWGGIITHYDGCSLLYDDLVLEHDVLLCSGIGNSNAAGRGYGGSWAKNALMVGGVNPQGSLQRENHRFSGYTTGPALDGRIKPDLVHFGAGVYCADAGSPRSYANFGGTSCATPLVAGHCGLMFEMWADNAFGTLPRGETVFDRKPHAATAKALMINSAYRYPMAGEKSNCTRFTQGWGMPDVGRLYELRRKLFVVDQETPLRDHQAVEYRLRVPENEPELRVTLAYTDPLGATAAVKTLVNDLDLIVVAPNDKRYFGNHGLLEGNFSKEGGAPDRANNVENVFLEKPLPGVWRVIVDAYRIAWDQHRGTKGRGQDFALVVEGVEPDPVLPEQPSK